jgi:hypothetical protein
LEIKATLSYDELLLLQSFFLEDGRGKKPLLCSIHAGYNLNEVNAKNKYKAKYVYAES